MAGAGAATASSTQANNSSDDSTRGRPYYEKLRRDLKQSLEEKRRLDLISIQTEERIVKLEAAYLEETAHAGNIVKGFDNYIKASASATAGGVGSGGGGTATRKRMGVTDSDKIFSKSSTNWNASDGPTSLVITNSASNGSGNNSGSGTPAGGSGRDTPGGHGTKGGNTKKRKGKTEDDDGDHKRGKVSWGRD